MYIPKVSSSLKAKPNSKSEILSVQTDLFCQGLMSYHKDTTNPRDSCELVQHFAFSPMLSTFHRLNCYQGRY